MWQWKLWKLVLQYNTAMAAEKPEVDQLLANKFTVDIFDARNYFLKEVLVYYLSEFIVYLLSLLHYINF